MIYPPPPCNGGIGIKIEHLECLEEGRFLNDIIIDFYLKYIMLEVVKPEVRERTHLFSTFFYTKLTSENISSKKRHALVKRWTKKDNIFFNEIIIIPINKK